jgi:acyl carrier protein
MNDSINTSSVEAKVREVLAQHGGLKQHISTIAEDISLSDAGMTSHASVNVMLALEAQFGEIPDRMLTRSVFRSVSSIAQAMSELATH